MQDDSRTVLLNSVKKLKRLFVLSLVLFSLSTFSMASELPANLQVVLLSKLMPYEKALSVKPKLSIFVINDQAVYQAFNLLKAKQRNEQLGDIKFGNTLPNKAYDIIYLDSQVNLSDALIYSLKFNSLLVTNEIDLVKQGITLGLSVKNGRPMFFLNKKSSDATGLSWDKTVLDIATLYN
nr:YfiR/HmsC family protein [Pseudoalteromonas sp. MMG024]